MVVFGVLKMGMDLRELIISETRYAYFSKDLSFEYVTCFKLSNRFLGVRHWLENIISRRFLSVYYHYLQFQ